MSGHAGHNGNGSGDLASAATALAGSSGGPEETEGRAIDLPAAERAAADLLGALGADVGSEHLSETPRRVAKAYAEMLSPQAFNATTFPNDDGYDELVLVRDIPFQSLCAHHLLPFHGTAHVAYLPGEKVVGLSRIPAVVDTLASRPQVQERLTEQIADALEAGLRPRGVLVVLDAEHGCVTARGARQAHSSTVTVASRGALADPVARAEIIALIGSVRGG
jgi:GTP cyclohydrolase I